MRPEGKELPKAIIADDEDIGRELLADSVRQVGLEPLCFNNGLEALEAIKRTEPALVLLDVEMPGLDGYSLCKLLRADRRMANTPILMVTGHEDSEAISLAFDAGATDFISKPVNLDLLPRRLEYILRNAAAAERIEHLAYYDALTGLPNRQRCIDEAKAQFELAAKESESVAVLYLDLNNFKRVNDTFGHATGDVVLGSAAGRLKEAIAKIEGNKHNRIKFISLSRVGGDEFLVIVRGPNAEILSLQIAQACRGCLREPISCNGLEFYCTPSVGIALYPSHGENTAEVFKHADTAMYQAKAGMEAPIAVYAPRMSARLNGWLDLEARLRRAIKEDRLYLHYQPKIDLSTNQITGVEALARWCDEEYGEISPGRFIEIAEQSGFIIELSTWLIRSACRQIRQWLDHGISLPVSINISGKDLVNRDIANLIDIEAIAADIPVSLIEVEITESVLISNISVVKQAVEKIKSLGCKVALDDFGTGYSSLAYISQFPPDRIKIDKSFVNEVDSSASQAAVATAIITLGKNLGVKVTAEGVEREEQLAWLKNHGCDEVQGYIFAKPAAADAIENKYFPLAKNSSNANLAASF
jgi:diguanylate cyclase (GGDEF)-like protein